jgi:hypothetical protein
MTPEEKLATLERQLAAITEQACGESCASEISELREKLAAAEARARELETADVGFRTRVAAEVDNQCGNIAIDRDEAEARADQEHARAERLAVALRSARFRVKQWGAPEELAIVDAALADSPEPAPQDAAPSAPAPGAVLPDGWTPAVFSGCKGDTEAHGFAHSKDGINLYEEHGVVQMERCACGDGHEDHHSIDVPAAVLRALLSLPPAPDDETRRKAIAALVECRDRVSHVKWLRTQTDEALALLQRKEGA